jgi:DNA-binding CsgD family transcriptional regulator/tetratricopeptide (TPR) repeat protein
MPAELLERGPILDFLAEEFAAAARAGRAVFVAGEAGAGKSAVVDAFAASLRPPVRVIRGDCDPLETPGPLAPIADVAWTLGGELEQLIERSAAVHEISAALLDNLHPKRVIVIEDLHWADAATLDVVRLVCRRLPRAAGLLIVTYRDDQIGRVDPMRVLLGEVASMPNVSRLHLEPLSRDAVADLAAGSGLDAAALHHQTHGNAFFVTEVLATGGESIPATVSDAVLARAARLTPGGRRLLDAMAVLTGPADRSLLAAIAGDDAGCVEECWANGLLVDSHIASGSITFRHELARRALEEAMPAPLRTTLHARALTALQTQGANDPATLAHHASAAGDGEATHLYARAAGNRAADTGAHTEAVSYLRTAVEHAPPLPSTEVAALYARLAYEAYLVDLSALAVHAQRRAVAALADTGDDLAEGAALATLSRMQWLDTDPDGAFESVARAVLLLERLPTSAELAAAYSQRSALEMLCGHHDTAITWGRRALDIAEQLGARVVEAHALNNIGCAMWYRGDEGGRHSLLRSLDIALEIDDLEAIGRAYGNLAEEATLHMRPHEARRYIEDGLAFSRTRGLTRTRVCLESAMAALLLTEARYDEASACLNFLEASPALSAVTRLDASIRLGVVRARRGDPGVWEAIEPAVATAERFAEQDRLTWAQLAEIEAAFLDDDLARARSVTELGLARASKGPDAETDRFTWWAQRLGIPAPCPRNARAPFVTALGGDHAAAADAFGGLGWRYEQALALFDAGDAESLRRALRILQEIGARPLARLVKRRMRANGDGPVPRGLGAATLANPARLTAREVEVLGLLGEDRTNREIADELVVSVRTVEHHVAAVLAKLDVSRRRDAVARAAQLGLVKSALPHT